MTIDDPRTRDTSTLSAAGIAADVERGGTTPWSLWLGYLSLGGSLTFPELTDSLAGRRPVTSSDLYLLVQALNL